MSLQKVHIRLRVGDTDRSIAFYEALFGAQPASTGAGTAVFDLDCPPLVLSVQQRARSRSPLSRFALYVDDPRAIGNTAIALRRAGVRLRLEDEGIEALDPDGNAWRVRVARSTAGTVAVAIL